LVAKLLLRGGAKPRKKGKERMVGGHLVFKVMGELANPEKGGRQCFG